MDLAEFADPPAEYRPVAMWFLNGRIEDAEARRQVRAMAAGGVGGIQVAARTGLEVPYLSRRWFELVQVILDEARQHGLAVWVADEYPYPSGASGGEVILRHAEYRAWQMHANCLRAAPDHEVRAKAPGSVLLRACGVPVVDGAPRWGEAIALERSVGLVQHEPVLYEPTHVYLTDRRYVSSGPRPTLSWRTPATADEWEVWLVAASEVADYKFFGSYVDLCNRAATDCFLATTYERYLAELGPERFAQLAGFFLDEAHPQNWSWQLPAFFLNSRGYDLVEVLPALWTNIGERTARVRYDYRQAITELFDRNFMRPVAEWCQRHGVALSLEVPSTRNIVQRHADVPGIDPGHDKVGVPLDEILARELPSFRGNLVFPASLAAQTGRRRVLDEMFHSVGWSLTLQDMKAMLDRAAARGANFFAFHAFCYAIGGLRKWDAPPSEFDQNPYWPFFPALSAYAGRLAYALSRGVRVAPIAIVDPITSIWAHSTLPGLKPDAVAQRVIDDWTLLMRELAAHQRPHDTVDPLVLAEAVVDGDTLRIGDATYRAILLPSIVNLEACAWSVLERFASSGGLVVQYGLLPFEDLEPGAPIADRCRAAFASAARVPSARSGAMERAGGFATAGSTTELLRLLDGTAPAELRLLPRAGENARRDFLLAQRRDGDRDLFLIANVSMQEQSCQVVPGRSGRVVRRLDLETGRAERVETYADGPAGKIGVQLVFPRHGAHLLLVEPEPATRLDSPTTDPGPIVDLSLDAEWQCEIDGDGLNVLRLDRFRFTLLADDGEARVGQALGLLEDQNGPLVGPKPLINTFRDLTLSGARWPGELEVVPVFGAQPRLRLRLPASAWYGAAFSVARLPAHALLCLETAAVAGEWDLWINGHRLPRAAFGSTRRWGTDVREANVAGLLVEGINRAVVRVRATEQWDGLLDALYLLGDFGVFRDGRGWPLIDERPRGIRWSARHTSGYPYFSGTLRLSRRVTVAAPEGRFRVRLPEDELMFAGVARLAVEGRDLGVRAWAPYVWPVAEGVVAGGAPVEVTLWVTGALLEQLEGRRYDARARRVGSVW